MSLPKRKFGLRDHSSQPFLAVAVPDSLERFVLTESGRFHLWGGIDAFATHTKNDLVAQGVDIRYALSQGFIEKVK